MHVSPAKHSYVWLPRKCDYQESVTTGQTDRETPDKVIPMCRYASQATQKLYCIYQDSNLGPMVYKTSAPPKELMGIPSSRVSIKRLVRKNTCDIFPLGSMRNLVLETGVMSHFWKFDEEYLCHTKKHWASIGRQISQMQIHLWTRHVFVKHRCPQWQQSQNMAKSQSPTFWPHPTPRGMWYQWVWATLRWTYSPSLVTVSPPIL